ncbi:MAG: hypothetical protein HKN86_03135 [Acidimicrobiia bacterium]|nr:hypothetical protein [Acidimicrobiia bacterium]
MGYNQKYSSVAKTNSRNTNIGHKDSVAMLKEPGDDIFKSVQEDNPGKTIKRVKGKPNTFQIFNEEGHSVTLTRYPSKKKDNRKTIKEVLQEELNKK